MARTIPMGDHKSLCTSHNTHFLKTEICLKNTYNTNINTKENTVYMQHNHTETDLYIEPMCYHISQHPPFRKWNDLKHGRVPVTRATGALRAQTGADR